MPCTDVVLPVRRYELRAVCVSATPFGIAIGVRLNVFNSFDMFYIVLSQILLGFLVTKYTITHEP